LGCGETVFDVIQASVVNRQLLQARKARVKSAERVVSMILARGARIIHLLRLHETLALHIPSIDRRICISLYGCYTKTINTFSRALRLPVLTSHVLTCGVVTAHLFSSDFCAASSSNRARPLLWIPQHLPLPCAVLHCVGGPICDLVGEEQAAA